MEELVAMLELGKALGRTEPHEALSLLRVAELAFNPAGGMAASPLRLLEVRRAIVEVHVAKRDFRTAAELNRNLLRLAKQCGGLAAREVEARSAELDVELARLSSADHGSA
jgi:hypothetical protein